MMSTFFKLLLACSTGVALTSAAALTSHAAGPASTQVRAPVAVRVRLGQPSMNYARDGMNDNMYYNSRNSDVRFNAAQRAQARAQRSDPRPMGQMGQPGPTAVDRLRASGELFPQSPSRNEGAVGQFERELHDRMREMNDRSVLNGLEAAWVLIYNAGQPNEGVYTHTAEHGEGPPILVGFESREDAEAFALNLSDEGFDRATPLRWSATQLTRLCHTAALEISIMPHGTVPAAPSMVRDDTAERERRDDPYIAYRKQMDAIYGTPDSCDGDDDCSADFHAASPVVDTAQRLKQKQQETIFKPSEPAAAPTPLDDPRKPIVDAHRPAQDRPVQDVQGAVQGAVQGSHKRAPARDGLRDEALAAIDAILSAHDGTMDLKTLMQNSLDKLEAGEHGPPSAVDAMAEAEAARLRFFNGDEEASDESEEKPKTYDWFGMEVEEDDL